MTEENKLYLYSCFIELYRQTELQEDVHAARSSSARSIIGFMTENEVEMIVDLALLCSLEILTKGKFRKKYV